MPKLPFSGFPGAAHYLVVRDALVLRYRFPEDDRFRKKTSRFRLSRNEKRAFFEWARKFLFSGGKLEEGWTSVEERDREIAEAIAACATLGDAVAAYLHDCRHGNAWMAPKSPQTLATVTEPVLRRFVQRFGEQRPLGSITRDEIAAFVRSLGGKKESKQRRLCPISNLFTWAIRQGHLEEPNPAHGIVFWRAPGETPHDGVRKSYTEEEFERLVQAAAGDPVAEDAIYLCRYLGLRPHDAVMLRWEDWKWEQLLVAVPRMKTRGSGVEVSLVDMHPVLAERYAHRRGDRGYCIGYVRRRTKIAWPSRAELLERCRASNQSAVARELGVTVQALRKRLRRDPALDTIDRTELAKSLTQRVSRITRRAGLYEKGIQPLYVLRHTFASDSLRRGTPPAIVAREMGISIDTLMKHYFHAIPRGQLDDRHANRWGLTRERVDEVSR